VTSPISEKSEFEIEFNQANTFWGVPFQFGNALKGIQIRQGIDHLVDRAAFAANDPNLGGNAVAIDNSAPPSDGLLTPNACGWDLFPNATETGPNCVVGNANGINTGGTAYHLAPACTLPPNCSGPTVWNPGPGSPDLCIAANHFIAAGIATGHNANCQLTGLNATAVANPPTFFIRNDNLPRLDLGTSLAQEICYLFTGSFSLGASNCAGGAGLKIQFAPIATAVSTIFSTPGKVATSPNTAWWIYTAGFGGVFPFDSNIFFGYNSQFVDLNGLPTGTPCATTTGSTSAGNYMYICVPQLDKWSSAMEFAACLSAVGDPTPGSASNAISGTCGGITGTCPATPSACSAVSAGFNSEIILGQMALTLPDYTQKDQFGYLSNWNTGVINSQGAGIPNYFTWLNSYLPAAAANSAIGQLPFVIRQGFKQPTSSLSPYQGTTVWDFYILGNIFDSIYQINPINNNQFFNWMTTSSQVICSPTTTPCSSSLLGYTPPGGTCNTQGGTCTSAVIRSVLANDLNWHDGLPVSSWDVRFSYNTLKATGSFQGTVLAPMLDVHALSAVEFDLDLNAIGPFTQLNAGTPTVIPGHLWSTCGASTWITAQSSLPSRSAMSTLDSCSVGGSVSSTLAGGRFDPMATTTTLPNGQTVGLLVGSGPWSCQNTQPPGTAAASLPLGTLGTGCSSSDTSAPPISGTFTLTRFGCPLTTTGSSCAKPGQAPYFRSSSTLALWTWTGMNGNFLHDFLTFSQTAFCFGHPSGTVGCGQWQSGIGNAADTPPSFPCTTNGCVGLSQITEVARFLDVGFTCLGPNTQGSCSAWSSLTGIASGSALSPSGDGVPAPVLYEGQITLNPASVVGCGTAYTIASPSTGGYDC